MTAALSAAWLLSACAPASPVHAQFDHWIEDAGTARWRLTVPPATWRRLGHGERLDAGHQDLSERTIETVSELIDAGLTRVRLCPGEWTMGEVRRSESGYLTFAGSCDLPVGTRT